MPLRFCFDPDEDTANLRAGMSAYLSIDTGRVRTLKGVSTISPARSTACIGRGAASAAAPAK